MTPPDRPPQSLDPPDLELVLADCLDGDRRAWAALSYLLYPRVQSYAHKLGVPASDCDEIVQEVLGRLFNRGLASFSRTKASFLQYLLGLTKNVTIDWFRRFRRRPITVHFSALEQTAFADEGLFEQPFVIPFADVREPLYFSIPDPIPGPEEAVVSSEFRTRLDRVLDQLREPSRNIIRRLYIDEVPISQVASEMERSVRSVRMIADDALHTLAESPLARALYFDHFGLDPIPSPRRDDVSTTASAPPSIDSALTRTIERPFAEAEDPYVVGRPVKGSLFVGRTDILNLVTANLSPDAGKNILVLRGQRRTGKTSVLLRLRDTLSQDTAGRYIPVFVDIQGMTMVQGDGQFFHVLAHYIWSDLTVHGICVPQPNARAFEAAPAIAFEVDFLNSIKAVLGERRILLMLDEFEAIKGLLDRNSVSPGVLEYCRHLMQHTPLLFLIAGTQKLRELTGGYWSVFFNLAVPIDIGTLKEIEARWLITEPVRRWYEVEPTAVNHILHATGCHPYFTQLVCKTLLEVRNESHVNLVAPGHVAQALDRALLSGAEQIGYPWTEADCTSAERIVLSVLAQECVREDSVPLEDIQQQLHDAGVNFATDEAVHRLQARGVLSQDEDDTLRFVVPLFHTWLVRNRYDSLDAALQHDNHNHPRFQAVGATHAHV